MRDEATLTREGSALVLTLRRPDQGNALSASLVESLHERLDEADRAGAVLVVAAEGRNFCTGFDVSEVADLSDGDLLLRFVRIEQLLARIWSADYPVIAVAQGRVVGAGADLFVSCSRRLAVAGASFAFPGAGFGLVLGSRRLAERVGAELALQWMGGEPLDASCAVRHGLASLSVAPDAIGEYLATEVSQARRLDPETRAALRAAVGVRAGLDADLANLVRSAARPGLRERILDYRAAALVARRAQQATLPAQSAGAPEP